MHDEPENAHAVVVLESMVGDIHAIAASVGSS